MNDPILGGGREGGGDFDEVGLGGAAEGAGFEGPGGDEDEARGDEAGGEAEPEAEDAEAGGEGQGVGDGEADAPVGRELLDKTPIGHLTPPEVTKQGVEMVVLCSRKPTTIDTPKKKEIRDKMFAQKYEAKSKWYLQEVRRAAMIEYR